MQEALFIPNPKPEAHPSIRTEISGQHARLNNLLGNGCKVLLAVPAGDHTLIILEHPNS